MKGTRQAWIIFLTLALCGSSAIGEDRKGSPNAEFTTVKLDDGSDLRLYVAGPEDAPAAVLLVHDYLGISDATKQSADRLGDLGYRVAAVDLYKGVSATDHEHAMALMQALDRVYADKALNKALNYLQRPGRKIATIGFSMGARESLNASLHQPGAVSATVMVYGFGFENTDEDLLKSLSSSILVITGSEDNGALQAGLDFLAKMHQAKQPYELFVYPGADHGYAQPMFNMGKNYNPEAVRVTWLLIEDFLASHLRS